MKKYESLKKVELHCHLDGSLNLEKVSRWTRKNIDDVEKALVLKEKGNLTKYLEMFDYPISLLQTKNRLRDAVSDLCKDMMDDGVIYAEIRFDPLSHIMKGLTLDEVMESALEGLNSAPIKAKLILCMKREREIKENKLIIDLAKKYLNSGVACVDLAGDESKYPLRMFSDLFEYANEENVPFIIHAGESGSANEIDLAISYGAKRIGHGISAITSFETMERLKEHNVPLEICPLSNMSLELYEKYTDHPVARLMDSGVLVTINTDNRTLINTSLTKEYNYLNKYFGLNVKDFNQMNRTAIMHSFLTDEEKEELLQYFN